MKTTIEKLEPKTEVTVVFLDGTVTSKLAAPLVEMGYGERVVELETQRHGVPTILALQDEEQTNFFCDV